ncbi:hypothetical protein M3Y97_00279700 [Aphelenchoides bicaudatus]|nr:hypothetical protein M3Y97_00279700 [Aphelenchoides bicaudatus]
MKHHHVKTTRWKTVDATFFADQPISGNLHVCGIILTLFSYLVIFFTLPFSAFFCIKIVQEYERAVIFRLGRLLPGGTRGPGLFLVNPCTDSYRKVDLRVVSFDVPAQEILSKDSVTVAVEVVVYFRISNAVTSVTNVEDCSRSTKLLAQTTLRNILGTKTLAQMLSDREIIGLNIQETLDEATASWGVQVERVEIKDVRLPVQLQRAMAAEAEASRDARAKVIAAEGERLASKALNEAASVLSESPSAIHLSLLQTLNTISSEKNQTIVLPIPIELIQALQRRTRLWNDINNFGLYSLSQYERAVIFRLGRLVPGGTRGPGLFFINPFIDSYRKVDLRVLTARNSQQRFSDNVVVYFRISNATISVTNIEDSNQSTKLLAQTTLRNVLGTKTLAEMLSDREMIANQMQLTLDEATTSWGRVEMKDVRLPVQLQRAMASEAEASRDARAKVIAATGEQNASQALSMAASVIAGNPAAIQLRFLQTLNSISSEKNRTIVFPFPIELIKAMIYKSKPKKKPLDVATTSKTE